MTGEVFSLHVLVEGRVQGVGFRYFVLNHAQQFNLVGWVRNTHDGDVEIQAEGQRTDLEKLLNDVRRGPQAALVTQTKVEWDTATGAFRSFDVYPTQ